MGRPRKKNKHLPPRVYHRYGSLWYVPPGSSKWIKLEDGLKTWARIVEGSSDPDATLTALWAKYELEVLGKKSPKTQQNRRQEWRALEPHFGQATANSIEAHHVWGYWRKRGETSQAKHEIRCLSALLTYARQAGALNAPNPCFGLKFLHGSESRDRYVTDDEFLAVRAIANPMTGFAMDLALITGMSQKDILRLERKQLLDDGIFFERAKTGKGQLIEWNDDLRAVVHGILKTEPQLRRVLICREDGKPYTSGGFQAIWQRLMVKASGGGSAPAVIAERFTFHDLRAKSLSDAKSLEEAQKRGGHSDSKMTQRVYRRLPVRGKALKISE